MGYISSIPFDEKSAFLYSLGATGTVAACIMATRFLNLCSSSISRKLLHILMAFVLLMCWPLFPNTENARCLAASIPFLFTAIFWCVGKGYIPGSVIIDAISRSGRASELTIGPVHYGIIGSLVTYFMWKQIDAIFVIMTLCFGDGFAACFGSIQKGNKTLWWNRNKTWLGLISYVVFSSIGIIGICYFFKQHFIFALFIYSNNIMRITDTLYVRNAIIVSIMCGLTESLTVANYDNITITVMAILVYSYIK